MISRTIIQIILLVALTSLAGVAIAACGNQAESEAAPAAAPAPAVTLAAAPVPAAAPQPPAAVSPPPAAPAPEPAKASNVRQQTFQAIREAQSKQRELQLPALEPLMMPADLESKIDEYIEAASDRGSFSGAILIAQGDNILLNKAYGMADYENGIANTPRTKFNIGSITASFTAAAILQLQEKGLLSVADQLSKYLPDYPNGHEITLHHLLVTTSGIPSYGLFPEYTELSKSPPSSDELIALFGDKPLDFLPGNNVSSSASNKILLGYIIEQVSGMPYEDYIQQNIFDPLGMSDSGYDINRPGVTLRAYGYLQTAEGPVREEPTDMSWANTAAGLYSTTEDLYRWDRALDTEKVLSKSSVDDMFTNYFDEDTGAQHGYGWVIVPRYSTFLIQSGGGPGVAMLCTVAVGSSSACLMRVPSDDMVMIALNNSSTSLATRIPADLYSIITGINYNLREMPTEKEYDAMTFDQYAGRFNRVPENDYPAILNMMQNSNFGAQSRHVTVTSANGGLFMEFEGSDFPTTQLFPESRSKFFAKANDLDITFIKTDLGGVIGFLVRIDDRDRYRYPGMPQ